MKKDKDKTKAAGSKSRVKSVKVDHKKSPKIDEDFARVHEFVRLATENNISEISLEKKDYKLTIKRYVPELNFPVHAPVPDHPLSTTPPPPATPPPLVTPPPSAASPPPAAAPAIQPVVEDRETAKKNDRFVEFVSPIIGTFYRRPSPDKRPYVEVGSVVKKGTVLCVVEAMKLFNEIECEYEGKIAAIFVEDGSPIEYGQSLFLIERQ